LKIKLLSLAILSASLLSTVHAKAATMDLFTITYYSDSYSFSLPDAPSPTSTGDGCIDREGAGNDFCIDPTAITVNGTIHNDYSVEFFNSNSGGGLEMFKGSGHILRNMTGSQLYTGTVYSPNFTLGTFYLNSDESSFKLVISQVPPVTTSSVPEPSSLVMMSSGLLAAAGAVRRKFKV